MAEKDYYGILGVAKTASADEIKSAYRRLAKKYHPDVFATAAEEEKKKAEAKFKEIQHAYDVLSDPQKKAAFDQYGDENGPQMGSGFGGASGFNPFGGAGGGGFEDIFSNIFTSFGGAGGARYNRRDLDGDDIEVAVSLTFQEACFGVEKEITYQRIEKCSTCKGSGAKPGTGAETCPKCHGKGTINVTTRTMFGVMQSQQVCDQCGGSGKIIKEPCPDCKGKGVVKKQRTVKVKIPAGVDNGQMLTMRGEGNASRGSGSNGNLIVVFRVKPHALFVRENYNLKLDLPITFLQAALGAKVEIPTLTNPVYIDVPEGTQDGTVLRVKGKGVKNLRKEAYGDLYVTVHIDVPKNLSAKQKAKLKEVSETLGSARYDKIEKYNKTLKGL